MVSSAAVTDLRTGLIPNRVIALGALAGLTAQLLTVFGGTASLGAALASMGLGLLLCSLVPGALYALGALGGGDLKLFAAIGLCAGPALGLDIQVWAYGLAVAFLPLYFLCRGGGRSALRNSARLLVNPFLPKPKQKPVERAQLTSFRFAPAIFVAALWVALFGGGQP
jgi:prepilin peptidase CpaA